MVIAVERLFEVQTLIVYFYSLRMAIRSLNSLTLQLYSESATVNTRPTVSVDRHHAPPLIRSRHGDIEMCFD